MKYDEMCSIIADLVLQPGTYIAKLEYSYQSEIYGTFDECESWEVFDFDGNTITWFNDWYEGQDNCYFDELVSINELLKDYRIVKKIRGLKGWPEDCYEQILQIFEKEGDPI